MEDKPRMLDVIERAEERQKIAKHILSELCLMERWKAFGRPVIVGAVAYDLVVSPDIDMEIYCPDLKIEHGFQIMGQCALHPNVTKARFSNELSGPDKALYWQLRYRYENGEEWKIDMWSAADDYQLPRSEELIQPMKAALTLQTREIILRLKEQRKEISTLNCQSIDLYRAVLDDEVCTVEELQKWLKHNSTDSLTDWRPRVQVI